MPKVRTRSKTNVRYYPFASGFKLPTDEEKIKAVGISDVKAPEYSTANDVDGFVFFKQIPQPTSIDDWLAQYVAKGQSYQSYLNTNGWLDTEKVHGINNKFVSTGRNICDKYPGGKIYLVPIGTFSGKRHIEFNDLAEFASIYLGLPVDILKGVDIDVDFTKEKVFWINEQKKENEACCSTNALSHCKVDLESRFFKKNHKYQIGIASLLYMLRQNIPEDALCLIGLTMSDLYREESDLFVAGWAAGGNHVAVFSFFRYDPSIKFSTADWYNIRRNKQMTLRYIQKSIFQRACKLLVHEIGHLLGIAHCIYFECCMNGSGHLAEDFRQPLHLCPVDLHKLQTLVAFNVLGRYKKLCEFYVKHEMKSEAEWVKRRITFLNNSSIDID